VDSQRSSPTRFLSSSVLVLIAVNLLPLWGAVMWNWSVFEIVLLYWMENVVIGAINVVKMATCAPNLTAAAPATTKSPFTDGALPLTPAVHHASKLFLIPFFAFHYGMFCLVHGIFVFLLLGSGQSAFGDASSEVPAFLTGGGGLLILAIGASHLWSLATNFFGRGEFRRVTVMEQMFAPYARVVVLHVAIVFGAFAIMLAGSPLGLLALLVLGKIALDAGLHLRAHRRK
jgi:hypothetical protein